MHPIRQHILKRLILSQGERFASLRPPEVENNHFLYYLNQLVSEGLVLKDASLYRLSPDGLRYAQTISLEDLAVRLQPKIVTASICFKKEEVLLFHWRREPGYGQYSLVSGKLHFGESMDEAAGRELREKTGLTAELEYRGSIYIREFKQTECERHQLAHIYIGHDPLGKVTPCEAGDAVWLRRRELAQYDLLPGTKEILERAEADKPFILELTYRDGKLCKK